MALGRLLSKEWAVGRWVVDLEMVFKGTERVGSTMLFCLIDVLAERGRFGAWEVKVVHLKVLVITLNAYIAGLDVDFWVEGR